MHIFPILWFILGGLVKLNFKLIGILILESMCGVKTPTIVSGIERQVEDYRLYRLHIASGRSVQLNRHDMIQTMLKHWMNNNQTNIMLVIHLIANWYIMCKNSRWWIPRIHQTSAIHLIAHEMTKQISFRNRY